MGCLSSKERLLAMHRRVAGGGTMKSEDRQRMDLDLMNQMKSLQVLGSDTLFVGVVVSLLCGRVYCGCV